MKTLFKLGASFLRAYVFKLVVAMMIPTVLVEPFQQIVSFFSKQDNIS